ncbi:aquaporin family protein, partial [Streptomyces niveiscabiei]
AAQVLGGTAGTLLAGVMFDTAPALSSNDRATGGHLVGEVVATAGLVLLIFALARTGKGSVTAAAVGAYIGAAYWFT